MEIFRNLFHIIRNFIFQIHCICCQQVVLEMFLNKLIYFKQTKKINKFTLIKKKMLAEKSMTVKKVFSY